MHSLSNIDVVTTHIMTMSCPDRIGIVAVMSQALVDIQANIVDNAQFTDPATSTFCIRTRFDAPAEVSSDIEAALWPHAQKFGAKLKVRRADERSQALIMVSEYDHCLLDLLYRRSTGEMGIDVPVVVSNHETLRPVVESHGIDFVHIPVSPGSRAQAEAALADLIELHRIDVVVLARYMQILSPQLCGALDGRIINIHHSFLPGFKGAKPYHQAWERGVKIIGATAHYVSADLDDGPIIAQDVAPVSHSATAHDMAVMGRDIERQVLSRAVRAHTDDRVFLLGARTIVFE